MDKFMKTKDQLIKFSQQHEITIPKSYRIKINGKYIRRLGYRGWKSIWSSKSAVKQALQLIVGDGAYKEKVNPVIEEYLKSGFIEIIEV